MSYSSPLPDFPTNLIVAQHSSWINSTNVNKLITTLTALYFPTVDSRITTLEVINSIVNTTPFSFDPPVRFPSPGAYLSTLDPLLDRIINQLRSALQYKDRLLEKTNINNQVCSVTSNTPAYLAAFNSFHNARLELILYVNNYTNYFYRTQFENLYTLTWS
jgi:hypothetical protein